VSEEEPDEESFEEKLREFAREFSESVEQAAERLDLEGIADQISAGGDRLRELAQFAGQWLTDQFGDEETPSQKPAAPPRRRMTGPHPLDVPTEEQGLALSALDSGRWRVEPGTSELIADGGGPPPLDPLELVGELRARDWIASSGEVTLVGRDALRRWIESR
jgi:hypothetical protein